MTESDLTPVVRAVLRERVRTFEALEAILLLHRSPERSLTAQDIATALRIAPEIVDDALAELERFELASRSAGVPRTFRYAPATPELAGAVDALAHAYAADRLGVTRLMSEYAIERMRTGAIRAFSDAFLIRRKDKDG